MKNSKLTIAVIIAIFAFVFGYWIRGPAPHPAATTAAAVSKSADMTCSMHPQIRQPKPGKCPLCGMDLISAGNDSGGCCGAGELKLSETAEKLAGIETAPVERRFVPVEIRMLGKISYNEETVSYINARFAGRIDKLFVKSTGVAVKKGDRLAEVYSPDLRLLQQELIQASNIKDSKPNDATASAFLESLREKYRLSGFTDDEINEIIAKGRTGDRLTSASQVAGVLLTITSPITGIVIDKDVTAGKYFEKGEKLITVADMSKVWINIEAYETDLPWLKYGQHVEFITDAYPGKKFEGRISLIQPSVDPLTRTVKVRLTADNKEGRLKSGMFAHAIIHAKIADDGRVIDPSLAGKWISPMHPEIIRDGPGKCDISGEPLVTAESLGIANDKDKNVKPPLVIPASAALVTGKRAVVYVSVPGRKGAYEGREVSLGPRAGEYFIVESGLREGEIIVTNGSFKIDSALQILARSSMMTMAGGCGSDSLCGASSGQAENPPSAEILESYSKVHDALFTDNHGEVLKNAAKLDAKYSTSLATSKDIWEARKEFEKISKNLYEDLSSSKGNLKETFYKIFCPMAFEGRGSFWLQNSEIVQNPYFGPSMPECGTVQETIGGKK